MRVALIGDSQWLDEELSRLNHRVVGLMDESIGVVRVVPTRVPEEEDSLSERISWEESRFELVNARRLAQLREAITRADVDVLHALCGPTWGGTHKLATALELPAVYTVQRAEDLATAARMGSRLPPDHAVITATTQPLLDALKQHIPDDLKTRLIKPGVRVTTADPPQRGETIGIAVSGTGKYDEHYASFLDGLARVIGRYPNLLVFFDGQRADQHLIYRHARRLGLLQQLSLTPHKLGHRELLIKVDALVHPQPMGRSRSLLLQTMAAGIPILAAIDSYAPELIDHTTCWLADTPDAQQWATLLDRLLGQPDAAQQLGHRARSWVGEHHSVSTEINQWLDLYRTVAAESIPFEPA